MVVIMIANIPYSIFLNMLNQLVGDAAGAGADVSNG
jgi:hypothetical protein